MTDGVVSLNYQLNISCVDMHYFCEYYSAAVLFSLLFWNRVSRSVQPVDQVNPSGRRDTTGCGWAGVSTTVALTLMEHARVPRHSLLEMMRRQVRWHRGHTQQALMGTLHGHVRWISAHHALGKEDEERTTT